eukprot:1358360-Pyramimonas_sp.AAC.1
MPTPLPSMPTPVPSVPTPAPSMPTPLPSVPTPLLSRLRKMGATRMAASAVVANDIDGDLITAGEKKRREIKARKNLTGIFSRRTNRTQDAWVYSHDGPIGRRTR